MRFVPFSYFCTCWKVMPSASPSCVWDLRSIIRHMRTRLPTCMSVGCSPFFGIVFPFSPVALRGIYTTCPGGEMAASANQTGRMVPLASDGFLVSDLRAVDAVAEGHS